MFGSIPDSGHDTRVRPVQFVWPYGGRSVLLSGSFTSWADHIPMVPVEACPTLFQVICNLTPGYHQYKFIVDGEWRHDEHQPLINGSYGVVNTVFVPRETDRIPTSGTPPGNMDLDDILQQQEVIRGISGPDLDDSRRCISSFLASHTAFELLPESGKVIALDVTVPVKQAFHILYEQGVPVAPLWDFNQGQFVGVLSAIDFILILRELGDRGSNMSEEELDTHTILAWKEVKLRLRRQIDGHPRVFPRSLIHAGPNDSLKEVALRIMQNNVSMVPIIHSPSLDGSCPQLLHLASLSGILKCICRQFKHSAGNLPILQQPVCAIPLGTWVPRIGELNGRPFAMLRLNASLGAALSLLVQAEVSSLPIVDDNDSLVDIYSRSDITALAKDKAYSQIRLDQISIQQALQLAQDATPHRLFNGQRCQMCLRTDPLHKVMERLANPGVRRVFIVEAGSKRVEGIISLRDVFGFLLQ